MYTYVWPSSVVRIFFIYVGTTQIALGTWDLGRKEQPWRLEQFAIFVDSMYEIESRYWAFEEGLSVSPFEQYVGPWKLNIDIFGNFSIWKHYYNQTKNQLVPLNKGISFPLSYYRQLAREIYKLLERYPTLKHALPCYKSMHSPLEKCEICSSIRPVHSERRRRSFSYRKSCEQ